MKVEKLVTVAKEDRTTAEPREHSLEDLYVRHAPDAARLAFLLTGDRELAEDVAQDAFIRVAGRFRHLRYPDAFPAYLRKTVVNRCVSIHRRAKVERTYVGRESSRSRPPPGEQPDLATRDELRVALRTLPMRQRAAIVLRYYHDLSEQQVANALECSTGAARSLVLRGMTSLREQIGRDDDA
jgi:RNA polymerase sigma-70 factor (sigma-E family)